MVHCNVLVVTDSDRVIVAYIMLVFMVWVSGDGGLTTLMHMVYSQIHC